MLGAERCMLGAERDGPGETGADRAGEFIWATMGAANTPSRRQLRKV